MTLDEELISFLSLLEEKGTQNLESKGVDYAYFISVENVKRIHLPKGEKPFIKFEDLFLEKLVSLHFSEGKFDTSSFTFKLFELLDPLTPILEQLSQGAILSYWTLKICLDKKEKKEEDIILSLLPLEYKQDYFSRVGHKVYKNLYKQKFNRDFVIHKLLIIPEQKIDKNSFENYKHSLLPLFFAFQEEAEKIAEKEEVSLVFTWTENLICSYTTEKKYIIIDDEFINKGIFLSLEYPEVFYNVSRKFLMGIRGGFLLKNASLDLQKKYWYALTAAFFVKDDLEEALFFFISHFVWIEYLNIGGPEFYKNGIQFSREYFQKVFTKEIEDIWSKELREKLLLKILKEREKIQE